MGPAMIRKRPGGKMGVYPGNHVPRHVHSGVQEVGAVAMSIS